MIRKKQYTVGIFLFCCPVTTLSDYRLTFSSSFNTSRFWNLNGHTWSLFVWTLLLLITYHGICSFQRALYGDYLPVPMNVRTTLPNFYEMVSQLQINSYAFSQLASVIISLAIYGSEQRCYLYWYMFTLIFFCIIHAVYLRCVVKKIVLLSWIFWLSCYVLGILSVVQQSK